jgi:hypothetical protein
MVLAEDTFAAGVNGRAVGTVKAFFVSGRRVLLSC